MLLTPLLKNAAERPDQLAVSDDRSGMTYAQMLDLSRRIAGSMSSATSRPRVGVILPSCNVFAGCFYGAMLAGKAIVPINFLLSPQQIAHVIADSGIDTIYSVAPLAEKFSSLPIRVIDLAALTPTTTATTSTQTETTRSDSPSPRIDPSSLAVLLYTSATTGMPKGVPLTHHNLASCTDACIKHVFPSGQHKFLGLVPLFHSLGLLATLIVPMALAAPVYYLARFSPMGTLAALREHRPTIAVAIPSMLKMLALTKSASADDFSSLFALLSGGEALPASLRETFLQRFGVRIMEGYGLSETCGPVSVNSPTRYRAGSVGQLLPGAIANIVDDAGKPAPPGIEGEILLGGPMVMAGYHNLPDATAAVMSNHLFRSGDLGKVDADGFLFITGRAKDLIIVSGEKLHPREIEELLLHHPAIADAAVVGRKDESRGEAVVAFLVAREGHVIEPAHIKEYLRSHDVPGWKIPREIITIEALPRSPTGKVLKRELTTQAEQLSSIGG